MSLRSLWNTPSGLPPGTYHFPGRNTLEVFPPATVWGRQPPVQPPIITPPRPSWPPSVPVWKPQPPTSQPWPPRVPVWKPQPPPTPPRPFPPVWKPQPPTSQPWPPRVPIGTPKPPPVRYWPSPPIRKPPLPVPPKPPWRGPIVEPKKPTVPLPSLRPLVPVWKPRPLLRPTSGLIPIAVEKPAGLIPIAVERVGGRRIQNKREPSPADLVIVKGHRNKRVPLHRLAAAAWRALVDEARAAGIQAPLLLPVSGYRSFEEQNTLWQETLQDALRKYPSEKEAIREARRWRAPPGHSAHQSGRAIDFYLGGRNKSSESAIAFLRTLPAYQWLAANAQRFGFYPYPAEPWHWEYNPPAK